MSQKVFQIEIGKASDRYYYFHRGLGDCTTEDFNKILSHSRASQACYAQPESPGQWSVVAGSFIVGTIKELGNLP